MPMASNLFGRYVWLIDLLRRHKHLAYKEINSKWQQSGLSYGEGDVLPLRTFHNHREAIRDIFDVYIEIDPEVSGYKYHIQEPERLAGDAFRSWLIDSYATLNQLQADRKLEGRIQFEQIPSGSRWLSFFVEAMRENKSVELSHQGFGRDDAHTFVVEPYHLKVVNRRWYVIANNPYFVDYNREHGSAIPEIRVYGLDRIVGARMIDKCFSVRTDFDIDTFYEGCTGAIPSDDPIERVVLKAYAPAYLRTLPLHKSQSEMYSCEDYALFAYDVKITYDFLQLIMQQGDQVEVLEPASLRKTMRHFAKTLIAYYGEEG